MIVSHANFAHFISFITFATAVGYIVVDVIRIRRALRERKQDIEPVRVNSDRIFGSIMGFVMSIVGIIGVIWYYAT